MFPSSGGAHLPEAEAYRRFFEKNQQLLKGYVPRVVFMGFQPRRPVLGARDPLVIADYPSASTGSARYLKDFVKRNLGARPSIAVVCGEYVRDRVTPSGVRILNRDMGFFHESVKPRMNTEFDVVYAGTLSRPGVVGALRHLAALGLTVAVASGDAAQAIPGVTYFGRLQIDDLYSLYSRSSVGLNVAPNTPPFAFQASTKVIEYSAAGIGVLTTRTPWIDAFEAQRGGRFMALKDVHSRGDVMRFPYRAAAVEDLDWDSIFDRCGLAGALAETLGMADP